jgi:FtsP/CotA-like multicopper oxidase with cupredoxin domain
MDNLSRRNFLKSAGMGGALLLSGTSSLGTLLQSGRISPVQNDPATRTIKDITLNASLAIVDLGAGGTFKAWAYNGKSPGPEIRVKEGYGLAWE